MLRNKAAVFFFVILTGTISAAAEDPAPAAEGKKDKAEKAVPASPHALIVEPKFMGSRHFVLLPDSKETGFVPAKWDGKKLTAYSKTEFRELEMSWKRFLAAATKTAEAQVASLEAKYYRGKNDVITHAIVVSKSPLLPSVIVTPAFRKKFAEKMGAEFYVAIPDRSTIYILPKTGGAIGAVGEEVEDLYDLASYPVSLELIEVKKDGIRAVGKFGEN